MNDHLDALGVAFATTGLFLFLVLMLLKSNDDTASALRATYRARREADFQRLRARYIASAKASAARAATFDQHAAVAEQLAADEPVPYMPVWTTGALDDDLSAEFEDLMHRAFITDEETRPC